MHVSQVTGDEKVRRDLEKNDCLLKNLIKLIFPIFHPKVIFSKIGIRRKVFFDASNLIINLFPFSFSFVAAMTFSQKYFSRDATFSNCWVAKLLARVMLEAVLKE